MLIKELLNKSSTLLEDLGSLKFIKKEFLPVLQTISSKQVPHDSEHGYKHKNVSTIMSRAGQKSKIETVPLKTAAAFMAELEKPEVLGAIIASGSKQLMIARRVSTKVRHNLEISYTYGIDYKTLHEIGPEDTSSHDNLYIIKDATKSVTSKTASNIIKSLKDKKAPIEMYILHADVERAEVSLKRKEARVGRIPQVVSKEFEREAKQALQRRLDLFKSSKAVGVDKAEELVTAIKEKGYLDKIKIAGFVYDVGNSRIDMDHLKRPSRYNQSYVEYKINQSTPEYKEMSKKSFEAYKAGGDIADEFAKTMPPGTIKIILKLEKGTIVPDRVETESY